METLGKLPPVPVPFLAAFIIYLLVIVPLIRRAIRKEPMSHAIDSNPQVLMNAGGVYTILTNIQLALSDLSHKHDDVARRLTVIDKMLRRRSGRSKKLKTPTEDPD